MKHSPYLFPPLLKNGNLYIRARHPGAFTLVEVMVSVGILAILVASLASMTNLTMSTVGQAWAKMEANQEARNVLDQLQIDFQNMLIRRDIDYSFIQQPGNDTLAFYGTEPGYLASSPKRIASIISYQVLKNTQNVADEWAVLERGANDSFQWNSAATAGMVFTSTPSLQAAIPSFVSLEPVPANGNVDVLNRDVFRFEISFLLKNTTGGAPTLVAALTKTNSISDIGAIVVTIATLDSHNRKLVGTTSGNWTKLIAALPEASDGRDTAETWKSQIESGSFAATAGIPLKAAAAVRAYERYYYLDSISPPSL